jgi:hypothetical protein
VFRGGRWFPSIRVGATPETRQRLLGNLPSSTTPMRLPLKLLRAILTACFLSTAALATPLPNTVGHYTAVVGEVDRGPLDIQITTQGRPNSHGRAVLKGTVKGLHGHENVALKFKGKIWFDPDEVGRINFIWDYRKGHEWIRIEGNFNDDATKFDGFYNIKIRQQFTDIAYIFGTRD